MRPEMSSAEVERHHDAKNALICFNTIQWLTKPGLPVTEKMIANDSP